VQGVVTGRIVDSNQLEAVTGAGSRPAPATDITSRHCTLGQPNVSH